MSSRDSTLVAGRWRRVAERSDPTGTPLFRHPGWLEELPWLFQATTAVGGAGDPFDLGLFGSTPVGTAVGRWRELRQSTGFARAVHSRQLHGVEVLSHGEGTPGLHVSEGFDGHVTNTAGVLLTISVADCVPIFLVDPDRRAIAVLHGGWRGVAGGVLERGVEALRRSFGCPPSSLRAHFGPAICGDCYEVGPEVHRALGAGASAGRGPIDLREELAGRALSLGIGEEAISISAHCTLCGGGTFFSHRGGAAGRQLGVIGVRPIGE